MDEAADRAAAAAPTPPAAPAPAPAAQNADEDRADELRQRLGANVTASQQLIDANLTLFRVGCVLTMVSSAVAAVRFSGLVWSYQCYLTIFP